MCAFRGRGGGVARTLVKIVLLGLFDALAVYWCVLFLWEGNWAFLGITAGGTVLLNWLVLSARAYPLRYLLPGLFFLGLMVVYPAGYTFYISFTNYSTGHILSKEEAIELILQRTYSPTPPVSFRFWAFGEGEELYAIVLVEDGGKAFLVSPEGEMSPLEGHELLDRDGDGTPDELDGHPRLTRRELFQHIRSLQAIRVPYGEGWLRMATLTEFRLYLPQYTYDAEGDILVDRRTGKVYRPVEGRFVADNGEGIDPGWVTFVGLRNYIRFFFDPRYHKAFGRVFLWTVEFAVLSVGLSFTLGLALAILLNDRKLRLRKLYRSLLIVPYAIPAFISILIWRGFFNTHVGLFNQVLGQWFGVRVPWLTDPFWARFSVLFANAWLTYPYMMLISLGALQSIPGELYEAAAIDGAGPWQRFTRITFPLLMVSLAPLLIGSFAYTFNNFTLIWLLTGGDPVVAIGERAGATDILLSYAYKLAFQGARGNEMGMASALAVNIFLIVALLSGIGFARTRMLEEVSRGM